jgi:chaperonin GroEL
LSSVAVKAPGFGDRRKEMLQDIATLTGAKVITPELGQKLEKVTLEDLGSAGRVLVDKDSTAIIGGTGDKRAIADRIERLRREIRDVKSDYDKEKLQERLAKLSGGVAVIHVGAATEAEAKARKEALEDAVSATKAAVAEGIVPGCGLALLRAIDAVKLEEQTAESDERTGLRILSRALEAPTRTIADNSGYDDGVVVERMRAGKGNEGFDAARGVYCDLVDAGIIDPTKVVRTGLENAVSVASVLLLSEATMTELPEPPKPATEHDR